MSRVRGSVQARSGLRRTAGAARSGAAGRRGQLRHRGMRQEAAGRGGHRDGHRGRDREEVHGDRHPGHDHDRAEAAPATVPMLHPAWNFGMIDRPSACSTAAAWTFIATSQLPVPKPNTNRPATTGGIPCR